MNKKVYITLVLIFLLATYQIFPDCSNSVLLNSKKQSTVSNNVLKESNKQLMMNTVKALAASSRPFGSDNEKKACEYIENKIKSYGYKTQIQTFSLSTLTKNDKMQLNTSHNLIAIKKSKSNYNKGIIIVCAHYDCTKDSVGANDNASGVSVVIETARLLKNVPSDYELRFVFFGGEEIGCLGSTHYIKNLSPTDKKNIKGVINIDSIAQKDGSKPYIFTISGQKNSATILLKNISKDISIKKVVKEFGDDTTFNEAGIPSLCIGQVYDNNLKINCPQDKISIIDESKLKLVADSIINSLSTFLYLN